MTFLHLSILRTAALVVPAGERAEWFREWSAELHYVSHGATSFCLGAFRDALWLRRNRVAEGTGPAFLESPRRCLVLLALLAAVSTAVAVRLPLAREVVARGNFVAMAFLIAVSVVVLSATTSLTLGDYPSDRHARTRWVRLRRWMFFMAKIALVLPVAVCGSLDVASVIAKGFQSHGIILGLILWLRWSLVDQRRRCPVCLRLLSKPTRIGGPSHTFLEWYGTELICARGHGMLYVPEIPTTSAYGTQRWQYLDRSWSSLFGG